MTSSAENDVVYENLIRNLAPRLAQARGQAEIVTDLKAKVFADAQVKFLFTKDGKREVKSI